MHQDVRFYHGYEFMSYLRRLVKATASAPPLARIFAHGATCLMYHRVLEDHCFQEGFHPTRGLSVRQSDFEAQMRLVARCGEPLSLPEAVRRLQAGTLATNAVIVTFDDGYVDNLTLAAPILRRHGVPATIYVTTDGPDDQAFLWWYELERLLGMLPEGAVEFHSQRVEWCGDSQRHQAFGTLNELMKRSSPQDQQELLDALQSIAGSPASGLPRMMLTWEQIRELDADPLITIGCHTTHHHPMAQQSAEELAQDLVASRSSLETRLGHPVEHFAYPYGQRAEAAQREFTAVREAGFRSAVTTRSGHWMPAHRNHLFALPRTTITCHDTLADFKLKLFGVRTTLANRGWRVVTD